MLVIKLPLFVGLSCRLVLQKSMWKVVSILNSQSVFRQKVYPVVNTMMFRVKIYLVYARRDAVLESLPITSL
jgi:hypothetical protein